MEYQIEKRIAENILLNMMSGLLWEDMSENEKDLIKTHHPETHRYYSQSNSSKQ